MLAVQRDSLSEPFEVSLTRTPAAGILRQFWATDIIQDREGTIWFALGLGEIVRYDSRKGKRGWRMVTAEDGLNIGGGPSIIQTRDGTIWSVSVGSDGVNRFDGKTWTQYKQDDWGGGNQNWSILQTRDGTLWIGGLRMLHAYRSGVWSTYRTSDVPMPGGRIFDLQETHDGALWIIIQGQAPLRMEFGTSRWRTYEGLSFQCEAPDGGQWFLSQDGGAVHYDGESWRRYAAEDGLMDGPTGLIATRDGVIWAAGSHGRTAATARLDGQRWSLQTHPLHSSGIHRNALYESSDGALWFGIAGGPDRERGQLGGVLRFDGKTWTHYTPPEAPREFIYGIGQSADGRLWFGGSWGLYYFDGQSWGVIGEPRELKASFSDVVYSTPERELWVGHRHYGAFHYDGREWARYDVRSGLAEGQIKSILQTDDGSIWLATPNGVSRFDGETWTTQVLPPKLPLAHVESLRQSRDGADRRTFFQIGKRRT
jgi:ligand-binding sensor domain-containing protein